MSEIDYYKGRPIAEAIPAAQARRLAELIEEGEAFVRIAEDHLAAFTGKRESKRKDRAARDYRRLRDVLHFLKTVKISETSLCAARPTKPAW